MTTREEKYLKSRDIILGMEQGIKKIISTIREEGMHETEEQARQHECSMIETADKLDDAFERIRTTELPSIQTDEDIMALLSILNEARENPGDYGVRILLKK